METTKKELAELILKYGDHKLHCNYRDHHMYGCSCGWNKAVDVAAAAAFSIMTMHKGLVGFPRPAERTRWNG